MTVRQLHDLLRGLHDSREIVVSSVLGEDVLHAAWRSAEREAERLYACWRELGGGEAYLAYRAAADRADAALDELAGAA
jgi:hypothetical protein